jgi:hypothetical protein
MVPIWRREFSNCQICPVTKGGNGARLFCLIVFKAAFIAHVQFAVTPDSKEFVRAWIWVRLLRLETPLRNQCNQL